MCVAAGVQVYLGGLCTNTMREHCHGGAFFYSASGDEGAGGDRDLEIPPLIKKSCR